MSNIAIRAVDVHKQYGSLAAVDGISLEVTQGECVALLGPNGAGKTTFTEILEGYRDRTSGSAEVLGVDPQRGDMAWRARLGIVLQSDRDLGDITVREAVQHFAGYYPNPADPDEVITAVGLTEKAKTRNDRLSGGQRRRLDVALGIVGQPELLFLDEPTTGFDPEARRSFWDLIAGLKDGGTTILLTTHYLDEAEALADRVAVIARGKIIAFDTPSQLGMRSTSEATVTWTEHGQTQTAQTDEPTALVAEISQRFPGEIPGLTIRRTSLEDTYLRLIHEHDGAAP
jgi:ABC-2 type transport system ATP-binding protein